MVERDIRNSRLFPEKNRVTGFNPKSPGFAGHGIPQYCERGLDVEVLKELGDKGVNFEVSVGGTKYFLKLNEQTNYQRYRGLTGANMEAEILANRCFREVGLKVPSIVYFGKVNDACGKMGEGLLMEWVGGYTVEELMKKYGLETKRDLIEHGCIDKSSFRLMQVVDVLIANIDRSSRNYLFDEDGKVIPVDHNMAFVSESAIWAHAASIDDGYLSACYCEDIPIANHGGSVESILAADISGIPGLLTGSGLFDDYRPAIDIVRQRLAGRKFEKWVKELPAELTDTVRRNELIGVFYSRLNRIEEAFRGFFEIKPTLAARQS